MAGADQPGLRSQWEEQQEDTGSLDQLVVDERHAEMYNCAICMKLMLQPVSLHRCGHNLCETCATIILDSTRECPTCRQVRD
jgi:hypothetical protein